MISSRESRLSGDSAQRGQPSGHGPFVLFGKGRERLRHRVLQAEDARISQHLIQVFLAAIRFAGNTQYGRPDVSFAALAMTHRAVLAESCRWQARFQSVPGRLLSLDGLAQLNHPLGEQPSFLLRQLIELRHRIRRGLARVSLDPVLDEFRRQASSSGKVNQRRTERAAGRIGCRGNWRS